MSCRMAALVALVGVGCGGDPRYRPTGVTRLYVCGQSWDEEIETEAALDVWAFNGYPVPSVATEGWGPCERELELDEASLSVAYFLEGEEPPGETWEDRHVTVDLNIQDSRCAFLHAVGHVLGLGHGSGDSVMAYPCGDSRHGLGLE